MAKIKICGLKRPEDVEYVNEFVPDFAGFVFAGEKRRINDETAETLKALLKPEIKAVGVFVNDEIRHIAKLANKNIIDFIQLHGDENSDYIKELRKLTEKPVIKAVRVKSRESINHAKELKVDYLLFDTYVKGMYGGSGETFDKSFIPDDVGNYFLAGGLNSSNLEEVLRECNPYAVDLSSGVETDGFKDKEKIKKVIDIVRKYNLQ